MRFLFFPAIYILQLVNENTKIWMVKLANLISFKFHLKIKRTVEKLYGQSYSFCKSVLFWLCFSLKRCTFLSTCRRFHLNKIQKLSVLFTSQTLLTNINQRCLYIKKNTSLRMFPVVGVFFFSWLAWFLILI